MALMKISIIPIGTATPSVGDYVAECIKLLEKEGVSFQLTDMGTIVEGEPSRLLELAKKIHEIPFHQGIKRVFTRIELDDRRDKKVVLSDKVKSITKRLEK